MHTYYLETEIAALRVESSETHVTGIYWADGPSINTSLSELPKVLQDAVTQIKEYFQRKRKNFDLPLKLNGTDFQKQVWDGLLQIPYGETISYQNLASHIGKHQAARAVGNANSKNPISIIVPCHRVIAADGTIGGYAGGLKTKSYLLELENA